MSPINKDSVKPQGLVHLHTFHNYIHGKTHSPQSVFFIKGAQYSLIIHEVLVAMGFFPAGVQDETLKEGSQRLAS